MTINTQRWPFSDAMDSAGADDLPSTRGEGQDDTGSGQSPNALRPTVYCPKMRLQECLAELGR